MNYKTYCIHCNGSCDHEIYLQKSTEQEFEMILRVVDKDIDTEIIMTVDVIYLTKVIKQLFVDIPLEVH